MITPEAFEKFMRDIQRQIDDADTQLQQKANDTLKSNSENYRNRLLEKMAEELRLAKEALEHGDDRTAQQHKIRADVYKSALDAIIR